MKGRKPMPENLRLLRGRRTRRPLADRTADPLVRGTPEKPDNLDSDASAEWDRLVTTLASVLSPSSRGILVCAVDAYSQLMAATRALKKKGSTYTTVGESGKLIRQRPEVRMREAARRAYQSALAELGASPVAQLRVHALPLPKKRDPDGIESYFETPTMPSA